MRGIGGAGGELDSRYQHVITTHLVHVEPNLEVRHALLHLRIVSTGSVHCLWDKFQNQVEVDLVLL
jgi:hypothetical protein